jgi:cytochrome b561
MMDMSAADPHLRTERSLMKPSRYHPALVALHWFLAAFIVLALGLGMFALKTIPNASPHKLEALRAHMIGAGVIFTLMLSRLVIRVRSARPEPATTGNPVLDRIARISHLAFYGLVAGMIATGLATAVLADLPSIVFGASGAPLPESFTVFPTRVIHGAIAKVLVALIAVHASAALYHHFVLRDGLLKRLWFGRRWQAIHRRSI